MLDLHTHSTFSDGSDTPAELVRKARAAGLRALALTDHDSVRGVPVFLAACGAERLCGIAGVEISAEVPAGTLHLLGLGVRPDHDELDAVLERMRDGREWRNRRILDRLRELGFDLAWEEVAALAGEEVVGRPHFARAMVARGWTADTRQAFDRYLAKGAPAYVDRYRPAPAEALRVIAAAAGVAVLAHPFSWVADETELAGRLGELRELGLRGIEAYYPEHTAAKTVACLRLARRLGLLATGGSDYHGAAMPDIRLGVGNGSLEVPDELLAPLLAAIGPEGRVHLET